MHISGRLTDIIPRQQPMETHPFPTEGTPRRGFGMTFNVAEYSHRLMTDFLMLGGRMRRREFRNPEQIAALAAPVIVNCTGYGARALWSDDSLTPVRGQINWLQPQTDRLYGVFHNEVFIISRRDGLVVQYVGPNDYYGLGVEDETPDPAEFEATLARVAPLFEWR